MGKIIGTGRMWRWLGRYGRDRCGNISVMVALLIVPLVGVMGVATETGNWFLIQRSMQNAADSAAIAAATNANATNNSYQLEGKSVATKFGYTNGANSTTVTIINNDNTVPAKCAGACYAVTITRTVPIYLTRVVGLGATQAVTAKAVAVPQNVPTSFCLVSLGGGDGYHINGGPSVDLNGCNVLSNGDVTCNGNGSSGNANSITYVSANKNGNCAPSVHASSALADPYSGQASNLPPTNCSSYAPTVIPAGAINANVSLTGTTYTGKKYCGNVTLSGDVTVTTNTPGSLLVIENGFLDLNGHTLSSSGGLTVVFTGAGGGLSSSMTGTFNYSAPTSGTWQGYAMYQGPTLPVTSSSASGNSLTWDISGIIYLPVTDLGFSGVVDKAANGLDCFVLVDHTFQSNGTGTILEHQSQCAQQGVVLPSLNSFVRTTLVY
jgi:Flp pilus assembly protein TadG